jgi:hypothetical protein
MANDKELVVRFFKSKGIDARQLPKGKQGKKSDFLLYLGETVFAHCELKSILDYDPSYGKIQKKIHEASTQLRTANPDRKVPNIIFFINHTDKGTWRDLWYVLTGREGVPNQPAQSADGPPAKRLVQKGDLSAIDYIVWADAPGETLFYVINDRSQFSDTLGKNISSLSHEKIDINKI